MKNRRGNVKNKLYRLTLTAIFSALVVVFQLVAYTVKIGPFGLTVTLVPVVLGAALLGWRGGAFLGGVFGAVVTACSIYGLDAGGQILFGVNPFLTTLTCMVKGIAAGLVAGLIFAALSNKNKTAAAVCAAAAAPVVNTSLFLAAMLLFFKDTLASWAGGTDLLTYILTGLVGINFIFEFTLNLLLSPLILAVLRALSKSGNNYE